jgi:uncharacterized phage protein gp47/JayE
MLIYAQQAFPAWNPTASEGDFGVALLELWAYVGDIISYYTDRVAQEAYLPTATQRLSLLNIAQLLGYTPSNGAPAAGTVTFVTPNPGPATIIPAGTQLGSNFNTSTDAPIIYQTTTTETCPANGGQVTINVTQGETMSMVAIGTSNGFPGQELVLPNTGVQDGTTQIFIQTVTGTQEWVQVSNFLDYNSEAMVYTVFVDANDNTNITFGDGINGLIPGLGMQIYATYTVIAGSAGNVPAGSVNTMIDTVSGVSIDINSSNVAVSSVMTGGADAESNDSIRANAPLAFQTQERAVSLDDFASLALTIPGVTLANATANHSTSVSLYFLGPGGGVPTTSMQATVLDFFAGPPLKTLAGVTLSVPTPSLISVDIGSNTTNATLVVNNAFSQQATLNNVTIALQEVLGPPNVAFGQLLQVATIYQTIMSVPGVSYTVIPIMTREDVTQANANPIQFRQSEVPVPGNFYFAVSGGQ